MLMGAQDALDLQERWVTAERQGDAAALERLLTADFMGVGPLGFMLTKEEWLHRHASGDLRYEELTWDDPQIRHYGDTTVTIGTQRQKATYQGRQVPGGEFRVTQIAVRSDGRWLIAGMHLSPIAPPPAGR